MTKVLTTKGEVDIDDVKVSDLVLDQNMKPQRVTKVIKNKITEMTTTKWYLIKKDTFKQNYPKYDMVISEEQRILIPLDENRVKFLKPKCYLDKAELINLELPYTYYHLELKKGSTFIVNNMTVKEYEGDKISLKN